MILKADVARGIIQTCYKVGAEQGQCDILVSAACLFLGYPRYLFINKPKREYEKMAAMLISVLRTLRQ